MQGFVYLVSHTSHVEMVMSSLIHYSAHLVLRDFATLDSDVFKETDTGNQTTPSISSWSNIH